MTNSLSLQNIMTSFRKRWSTAADIRKPSNSTRYRVADGILAAFAVFFMQSRSFLEHQRLLESKKGRSNARSLFQVEEIPSDPQIRNLVDPISSTYFQEDFWFLLDKLKEEQHLFQFRNELNTYSIVFDGVSFFFFGENCLPKVFKTRRPKWRGAFLSQRNYTCLCEAGSVASFTATP